MAPSSETSSSVEDVTGYVYCPPDWDEIRLRTGSDADAIRKIAMDTYTDIAYIKEKNAIQISGECHDDVYKAQNQLNALFFPPTTKSKKQWARPDRPGGWGQRRDSAQFAPASSSSAAFAHTLRRMKSESALQYNAYEPIQPTPEYHGSTCHTQPSFHPSSYQPFSYSPHRW